MKISSSMLSALSILVVIPTISGSAGIVHIYSHTYAATKKSKTIRLSFIDETENPIALKIGEDTITLTPKTPVEVRLPLGERVVFAEPVSGTRRPGELVVVTSEMLSGALIHIK